MKVVDYRSAGVMGYEGQSQQKTPCEFTTPYINASGKHIARHGCTFSVYGLGGRNCPEFATLRHTLAYYLLRYSLKG